MDQIYWKAARAIEAGMVSIEQAAKDINLYLSVEEAKAKAKIEECLEELKKRAVIGVDSAAGQGIQVTEDGEIVEADFGKADESRGNVLVHAGNGDGIALHSTSHDAELLKQLSFVGLPRQGSPVLGLEVRLAMVTADEPLRARVRLAVEGEADGNHVPLTIDDVVLYAFGQRGTTVEKWNNWSATRRSRVIEAEIGFLRAHASGEATPTGTVSGALAAGGDRPAGSLMGALSANSINAAAGVRNVQGQGANAASGGPAVGSDANVSAGASEGAGQANSSGDA